MALQILPILKALAPLIAQAGGVAAGLRSSSVATKMEDRVAKLEHETIRASEVLTGVAEQLQALAQELRVQAAATELFQKRAKLLFTLSLVAVGVSVAALVVAIAQ